MANYTPNYGLIKPEGSDNVAVQQLNTNMDTLDTTLKEQEEKINMVRVAAPPYIDETTKHWMVYDPDTKAYEDSGVDASARNPYINTSNAHWMIWDPTNEQYVDSGIVALGVPATFTATAATLAPGSSATANVGGTAMNPVLNLGIPRGTDAGFGTPSASVDTNVGTPSVDVTASGPDTAKQFTFAFHNLKGEPGASTAEAAQYAAAAAASAELAAQHVYNIDVVGHVITVTQQQHGFTMTVVGTKVVVQDVA